MKVLKLYEELVVMASHLSDELIRQGRLASGNSRLTDDSGFRRTTSHLRLKWCFDSLREPFSDSSLSTWMTVFVWLC